MFLSPKFSLCTNVELKLSLRTRLVLQTHPRRIRNRREVYCLTTSSTFPNEMSFTNPPGGGHDLLHFFSGVYIWRRTSAVRQIAPMNHAGSRIEVSQIPAELAQHGDMVNPGADAQGFQALEPALDDFARDGFSRFDFSQ